MTIGIEQSNTWELMGCDMGYFMELTHQLGKIFVSDNADDGPGWPWKNATMIPGGQFVQSRFVNSSHVLPNDCSTANSRNQEQCWLRKKKTFSNRIVSILADNGSTMDNLLDYSADNLNFGPFLESQQLSRSDVEICAWPQVLLSVHRISEFHGVFMDVKRCFTED